METIQAIKPGPKPKTDEGKDDKRRRVNHENQPKTPFSEASQARN